MRLVWFITVLALALTLIVSSAAASAPTPSTTYRVDWKESTTIEGGTLEFRVRRLVVQGPRWTVRATVVNRSTRTIHIDTVTYPSSKLAGMSLAYPVPASGGYGYNAVPGINVLQLRVASPKIPTRLAPGQAWTGTFGSFGVLPKAKPLWVIFGWFTPDGRKEESFNYITDGAFRLKR